MDSPSILDISQDNVGTLRKQLQTYQSLNMDLSKKIQQLKIELHEARAIGDQRLEDLIEEKRKFSEFKRLFFEANQHCVNFFKDYFDSIQEINDLGNDMSFGLPGQQADVYQNNGDNFQQNRNHHFRPLVDPNMQENLGAISEESLAATSTPFHQNRQHIDRLLLPANFRRRTFESFVNDGSSTSGCSTNQGTPKKASTSCISNRRLSEKMTDNEEEEFAADESFANRTMTNQLNQMKESITKLPQAEIEQDLTENDGQVFEPMEQDEEEEEQQVETPSPPTVKKTNDEEDKENKSDNKSQDEDEDQQIEIELPPKPKKKKAENKEDNSDNKSQQDDVEQQVETQKSKKKKAQIKKSNDKSQDDDDEDETKTPPSPKRNVTKKKVASKKEKAVEEPAVPTRSQRQKRKANYAEPPLNSKMRRDK